MVLLEPIDGVRSFSILPECCMGVDNRFRAVLNNLVVVDCLRRHSSKSSLHRYPNFVQVVVVPLTIRETVFNEASRSGHCLKIADLHILLWSEVSNIEWELRH